MHRQIPPEVHKLWGWLMKNKQFDDANFVGDVMRAMENSKKLSMQDSMRFAKLVRTFKKVELIQGIFKGK